jgi:hypothetical protein
LAAAYLPHLACIVKMIWIMSATNWHPVRATTTTTTRWTTS